MSDRTPGKWSSKQSQGSGPSKCDAPTAVAVNYSAKNMHAPQVSVKGSEMIALEMKAIAKRFGVPIHQSKELTEKLSKVEVSSEIPHELYEDMSKIFLSIEGLSSK